MKDILHLFSEPAGIQFLLIGATATLAVIFAFGLLYFRNPVHAALCLIGNFVCLAAIYVMMGSFLMGVVQLVVYAGAIMVLFLFVIMFFFKPNLKSKYETNPMKNIIVWGIALGLILFGLITGFFWTSNSKVNKAISIDKTITAPKENDTENPLSFRKNPGLMSEDTPKRIESKGGPLIVTGFDLLNKNIVSFELISLLLLAAIIGSVVLVKYLSESPNHIDKESSL